MITYNLPRNYSKNDLVMKPYYLEGFEHFFYANFDEPIGDAGFSSWVLALYDSRGNLIADDIGEIIKDEITASTYRFYASFIIPIGVAYSYGEYQLTIYNSSSSFVVFQDIKVGVINDMETDKFVLLEFRNSTNIFNFNYEEISDYNSIFLPLNVIEEQPEFTISSYREKSTGLMRNQKSQMAKVITLEAYFFDTKASDMMSAISLHDDIKINGVSVSVKTGYKIDTDKNNSVQKGVIELYDNRFSTSNLSGNASADFFKYYFGTTSESDASLVDISLGSPAISNGVNGVSVKWTGTAVRLWVWFPNTVAVKTDWSEKDNELNSGEIGGTFNLFGSKVAKSHLGISGGIYLTNFVTVGKTLIIQ